MTLLQALFLFSAALLGGALNSVAGGGSFFAFPALLLSGVPAIQANATTTIALWPGTLASVGAYRKELEAQRGVLVVLGATCMLGGLIGAVVLLHTPPATFEMLLPYLLLGATLLFAFGGMLTRRFRRSGEGPRRAGWWGLAALALLQFPIAIYGGFFGGGIGILMLALMGLAGMENIHSMNALKTLLATLINAVAVVTFIVAGAIYWPQALVMVVGGALGGYYGAYYARKVNPVWVRRFVIVVGLVMSTYFFVAHH